MFRVLQNVPRCAGFHHHAAVHDNQMCSPFSRHRQVMGDQQHSGAELCGEQLQMVEYVPLGGDVQRGGRLVGDQQSWTARQPDGNQRTLAQPPDS